MAKQSLTELISAYTKRTGPPCLVEQVLTKMNNDERKELIQALANEDVKGSAITRALNVMGYKIGSASIYRHRRKDCNCEPK